MPDTVDIRRLGNGTLVGINNNNPTESTTKLTFHPPTPNTTTRMPYSSRKPSSKLSTVSFSGRGFDMIRSVAPPRITNYPPPSHQWPQNLYSTTCVPPPGTPSVPHNDVVPPPVPNHDVYSQVVPGIYYPYHGMSSVGPTFHEHMLNHSPSPHITQGPSYQIHPKLDSSAVFGAQPIILPSVTPGSVCERELNKSFEKLMESVTNQVLLGTSAPPKSPLYIPKSTPPVTPNPTLRLAGSTTPPSYLARSTTPPSYLVRSTTPPSYLVRSTTPPSNLARSSTPPSYVDRNTTSNRMQPFFTLPPHSPAYRTEYTPSAVVTNESSSLLQVTPLLLRRRSSP